MCLDYQRKGGEVLFIIFLILKWSQFIPPSELLKRVEVYPLLRNGKSTTNATYIALQGKGYRSVPINQWMMVIT